MKAWMLAPVLTAAIVTAPVASPSPDDPIVVRGIGADACADFARDYAQRSNLAETQYYTWAQGFMSGANIITGVADDGYRDLDGDINAQQLYLRQYCDAHPHDQYTRAVFALYRSLPHRPYQPK